MLLSEHIAKLIEQMIDEGKGTASVKRNDLAAKLGCVPSQVSYVISSRFTPQRGYITESRRGGGGYIRITRVQVTRGQLMMHVVNSIGAQIDSRSARMMVENLAYEGAIDAGSASLILCAVSDNTLKGVPHEIRDALRATLLKKMLMTLMTR